jgi:serine/threonine-protein kinase
VKPDNVFLVPRNGCTPLVKLLDFGMCRRGANSVGDDRTLTRAGQVVGTPEYMSPEQVSGKRNFDGRIDLYAVGVILYEALSGQRAFPGKDAREVVVSVLVKSLPPLRHFRPDIPSALDRIVAKAMEKDANARYSSAHEFQHDLLEAKRQLAEKRRAQMQTGPRRIDHGQRSMDLRSDATRSVPPPARSTPRSVGQSVESDEWDNQPTVQVRQLSRPARIA